MREKPCVYPNRCIFGGCWKRDGLVGHLGDGMRGVSWSVPSECCHGREGFSMQSIRAIIIQYWASYVGKLYEYRCPGNPKSLDLKNTTAL